MAKVRNMELIGEAAQIKRMITKTCTCRSAASPAATPSHPEIGRPRTLHLASRDKPQPKSRIKDRGRTSTKVKEAAAATVGRQMASSYLTLRPSIQTSSVVPPRKAWLRSNKQRRTMLRFRRRSSKEHRHDSISLHLISINRKRCRR